MGGGGHDKAFHPVVKGHVNYLLSPNRQVYFKGFFTKMPKTFLKKLSGAWAWLPGLGIGYGIYKWAGWKEADIKYQHRV